MNISAESLVSITEANRNFSKVARLVDSAGAVVILKNNVPRYVVLDFRSVAKESYAADEDVLRVSRRLIAKNLKAYEELAK